MKNAIDVIKSKEFNSLDYINRFNKTRVFKYETVSQHSYWVTMFAVLVLEGLEDAGMFRNFRPTSKWQRKYEVLQACIFHDFDESITGDILFNFKHNDFNGNDVKKSIQAYIKHKMKMYENNTVIENTLLAGLELSNSDKMIKYIVKLADWLACIKYEWAEIQMGNKDFDAILVRSEIAVNKLVVEFITHLHEVDIVKAGKLFNPIEEYLKQYQEIITKLNK